MSISHRFPSRGALDHLVVRGTINVANAPEFRTQLLDAIENCRRHLVIDVTDVDFADPSGLGVLIGALRNARLENKCADVVCTDQRILEVFALSSVDQTFNIYESLEAAIDANLELRHPSTTEPTTDKAVL